MIYLHKKGLIEKIGDKNPFKSEINNAYFLHSDDNIYLNNVIAYPKSITQLIFHEFMHRILHLKRMDSACNAWDSGFANKLEDWIFRR